MRFGVWGLGFEVAGLRCGVRVYGVGCRIEGVGCRVWRVEFKMRGDLPRRCGRKTSFSEGIGVPFQRGVPPLPSRKMA